MQARADLAAHVARDLAEHLPLFDLGTRLHGDRFRVHVKVVVVRAVVGLELHGGVRGHADDRAVLGRNSFPIVVLPGRRADVLPLMARAARAERHVPASDLTIVVALLHGIEVARIVLAAAGGTLSVPTPAAVTPDLRVHVREEAVSELQRKDHVRHVDKPVGASAAGIALVEIARRIVGEPGLGRIRRAAARDWRRRSDGTFAGGRCLGSRSGRWGRSAVRRKQAAARELHEAAVGIAAEAGAITRSVAACASQTRARTSDALYERVGREIASEERRSGCCTCVVLSGQLRGKCEKHATGCENGAQRKLNSFPHATSPVFIATLL